MNMSPFRTAFSVTVALAVASLPSLSQAQQNTAPSAAQVPALTQPQASGTRPQPFLPPQRPQPSPTPADSRSQKSTAAMPHDMSSWSMFLAADVLVKAVMIGLAFASLVTWTIFIAKMIEFSVVQRKLRAALGKISEARSLAEAQFALGAKEGVLPSLLAAAMREARLSAGISSDAGIKERAASSFAEIVRAEARRIRFGMGLLATIGATSPFVGLFGTVWGIMNSFIGICEIADHQPCRGRTRHRRSAARHRARPGRGDPRRDHLQSFYASDQRLPRTGRAVRRAPSARLLSRDLDRTHGGGVHSRAAE